MIHYDTIDRDSTVNVATVVHHSINISTVTRIPDTDREIPASGDEQVRQLAVPQQTTHRSLVAFEHHHTAAVAVVPDATRSEVRYVYSCDFSITSDVIRYVVCFYNKPVVGTARKAAVSQRRPPNIEDFRLVTAKLFERVVGGGQVEDANDLIVAARRNQISAIM